MSDFNSGLPVRTESAGDVIVKIADATTPSQQLSIDSSGRVAVKLDDGNGNIITSQANGVQRALDVGIDVAGVQIDPRAVRALTSSDVVTANIKDSSGASITLGTKVSASSIPVVLASDQASINIINAADGSVTGGTTGTKSQLAGGIFNTALPTLTTGQQAAAQFDSSARLIVAPLTSSSIVKSQLQDNSGTAITLGSKVSASSMPVVIASDQGAIPVTIQSFVAGTEVNDYNTAVAVAAGATSNHDYTITTTKTFKGKKIWATSSGKMKIEVQVSPDGTTFNTKWVGFNSTANPNIIIDLDLLSFTDSGTGSKIRVIRTNKDLLAMDVYSTLSGNET